MIEPNQPARCDCGHFKGVFFPSPKATPDQIEAQRRRENHTCTELCERCRATATANRGTA
jgi:hypothetical protein